MKKILICLIMAIILTNCEVGIQKSKAQEDWATQIDQKQRHRMVEYIIKEIDGMRYIIGSNDAHYSSPFFVNLTKEKLEVELLQLQINELKNK